MATPKKRYNYTFLYTDQTYLTYELTKDDFQEVENGLTAEQPKRFVAVSIGVIGLDNVRSVIEQKEPEETEVNESELPVLDQESYNWIKQYMGGE